MVTKNKFRLDLKIGDQLEFIKPKMIILVVHNIFLPSYHSGPEGDAINFLFFGFNGIMG